MKFRFCGDLDCPEWILAEISLLAKLTSIKLKLLCQNVIAELIGKESQIAKAEKILTDANFDKSQIKGCIASLLFIYRSASKHDCDSTSLNTELQQLGLQSELCQQLCKIYDENLPVLRENVKSSVLKLSSYHDISVDAIKDDGSSPYCVLKFRDHSKKFNVAMSSSNVTLMINDLEEALKIMESYESK